MARGDAAPFRILSLSGGGARGIFQAAFLSRLERDLGRPLNQTFELVAGTSTGGILGLAIAAGIPASEIGELYRRNARAIFRARFLGLFRRGARYSSQVLARELERAFGSRTLGELEVDIVVTASAVETHGGKIFTRTTDPSLRLVEAALATAAAPTYFAPVTPVGTARSYLDGGLWANDPALVAILQANHRLRVPLESIRTLAVGTGIQPAGHSGAAVAKIRPFSVETPRLFFELVMGLQAWFSAEFGRDLMSHERFVVVNPPLRRKISLDDAVRSIELLPALAEECYDEMRDRVLRLLVDIAAAEPPPPPPLTDALVASLEEAHVTGFYPSRAHYAKYRIGESIDAYVGTATETLVMVSINLATGVLIADLLSRLVEMIDERTPPVEVTISLLDPRRREILETLAPVLNTTGEELEDRVSHTLKRLVAFRDKELSAEGRSAFALRVHKALPAASAILIDHELPSGRIQLETKPYRVGMQASYAIEVGAGSELYTTLVSSYERLVDEGIEVEEWPPGA